MAEQARLEEERRRKEEEDKLLEPIEVARFGTGDVRGMLLRTFQDLYELSNLGAPLDDPPPTDADGAPETEGEPDAAEENEEEGQEGTENDSKGEEVPEYMNEDVKNRVRERTDLIQGGLEGKLKEVLQLEDYLVRQSHVAKDREHKHLKLVRDHGLHMGVDIPVGKTFLQINKRLLKENNLINLDKMMKGIKKEKLDLALQRVPETPPKLVSKSDRRARMEAQQETLAQERAVKVKTPARILNMTAEERKKLIAETQRRRRVMKEVMTATELHENKKIAAQLQNRQNFLRNPRYANKSVTAVPTVPLAGTIKMKTPRGTQDELLPPTLEAQPSIITFDRYVAGQTYSASIKLRNVSRVSRRVRVFPLASRFFHASNPVFNSGSNGDSGSLAAGIACEITVEFAPDSLDDYEDTLVVATEAGRIDIPIIARRSPPVLTIASMLDAGVAWTNDRSLYGFPCINAGANRGTFWLIPDDHPDYQNLVNIQKCTKEMVRKFQEAEERDEVVTGPFTISPAKFDIAPGQKHLLKVLLEPTVVGRVTKKLVLLCDNTLVQTVNVTGEGWEPDIELTQIEDMPVQIQDNSSAPISVVFDDMPIKGHTCKEIVITNKTPLPVPFHWMMMDLPQWFPQNHYDRPLEDVFFIEPNEGEFPPNTSKKFVVTFLPDHAILYRNQAQLVIRKPQKEETVQMNFKNLDLQGRGTQCEVSLEPSVLMFGEPGLPIGIMHTQTITIVNHSNTAVDFAWPHHTHASKASSRFSSRSKAPSVASNRSSSPISVTPAAGTLAPNQKMELTVSMEFDSLGLHKHDLACSFDKGTTSMLRVEALVIGPTIRMKVPCLDFGLLNLGIPGVKKEVRVPFVNASDSEASFSFCEKGSNPAPFLPLQDDFRRFQDSGNAYKLTFNPTRGVLGPREKGETTVTFVPTRATRLRTHIECHVKHGDTQYVTAKAEVQAPKVVLYPMSIDLDDVLGGVNSYVGIPRSFKLNLRNLTNLQAVFKWTNHVSPDFKIRFSPEAGEISGKGIQEIAVEFVALKPGKFDDVFGCDIEGADLPLPFKLRSTVRGLEVSYHLETPETLAHKEQASTDFELPESTYNRRPSQGNITADKLELREIERIKANVKQLDAIYPWRSSTDFPSIDFGENCPIFDRASVDLVIRNHTGIPTCFDLSMSELGVPPEAAGLMEDYTQTLHNQTAIIINNQSQSKQKTDTSLDFSLTRKSRRTVYNSTMGATNARTMGVTQKGSTSGMGKTSQKYALEVKSLLTANHEVTEKFQSEEGKKVVAKELRRDVEKKCLQRGTGVVFFAHPSSGRLGPFETVKIRIVSFNDMCGKFRDTLQAKVKGLPTVPLPVQIGVIGSPVSFSSANAGMVFDDKPPVVDSASPLYLPPTCLQPRLYWRPVPSKSSIHTRQVRLDNAGPMDIKLVWNLYDMDSIDKEKIVDVTVEWTSEGARTRVVPYQVQVTKDFPFSISPSEMVIPAYGSAACTVSFDASKLEDATRLKGFMQAQIFVRETDARRITTGEGNVDEDDVAEDEVDSEEGFEATVELSGGRNETAALVDSIDSFEANLKGIRRRQALKSKGIVESKDEDSWADVEEALAEEWVTAPESLQENVLRLHLASTTVASSLQVDKPGISPAEPRVFQFTAFPPKPAQEETPTPTPPPEPESARRKKSRKAGVFVTQSSIKKAQQASSEEARLKALANRKTHGKCLMYAMYVDQRRNFIQGHGISFYLFLILFSFFFPLQAKLF